MWVRVSGVWVRVSGVWVRVSGVGYGEWCGLG